ncbi:MAG: hypothetical protein ACPL06_02275 [Candidatus Anstonellales archaeon]
MAQTAEQRIVPQKSSYKKSIIYEEGGKKVKVGEMTFYPLGCYTNGAFDVEAGYFLVAPIGGNLEEMNKNEKKIMGMGYERGYYKYTKINFGGEPVFYYQKFSDEIPGNEQIEELKKSKINITITPKYRDLEEDEACKDFAAKGVSVEKKKIYFEISASHMAKLDPYYYGTFYFANAASFSGYTVKSSGMRTMLKNIVDSKGYYFVCDSRGDEKQGRSLVVLGLYDTKDLMFLKIPKEKERIWENVFEIQTDIEKYYSLAFFTTDIPTDVTPLRISSTMDKFYKQETPLSIKEDAIIFSTR